jgi:hypothetical protein
MAESPNTFSYQYYVTAFIDILGQRDKLRRLTGIPKNIREREDTLQILRSTVGAVRSLREDFKKYFSASNRPLGLPLSIGATQYERIRRLRSNNMIIRGFSDSMILNVSLKGSDENLSAIDCTHAAINGVCAAFILSLAKGIPVRGGIDVGTGIKIEEDEVYGSTLQQAYDLETREAGYPRIVVGDELWNYLSQVEAQRPISPYGLLAKRYATMSKSLIVPDEDGNNILDPCGMAIRNVFRDDVVYPQLKDAIRLGYRFAVEQHAAFEGKNDEKMTTRYARLKRYYEARLHLWDIDERPVG